ncbi:hypothetical protein V6N11_084391 [Hibiscus sabdariffa]|uniref:Uncharacterized protein n=1 Tax=Hibiscus sabdariffa TaxID=183260 RepID=A0ABR2NBZ7_9ROSI
MVPCGCRSKLPVMNEGKEISFPFPFSCIFVGFCVTSRFLIGLIGFLFVGGCFMVGLPSDQILDSRRPGVLDAAKFPPLQAANTMISDAPGLVGSEDKCVKKKEIVSDFGLNHVVDSGSSSGFPVDSPSGVLSTIEVVSFSDNFVGTVVADSVPVNPVQSQNSFNVLVDGQVLELESFDSISSELVRHFTEALGTVDQNVVPFSDELLKELVGVEISADMRDLLVALVTSKEIKGVLFAMNGNKAPSPYRYPASFFQLCS